MKRGEFKQRKKECARCGEPRHLWSGGMCKSCVMWVKIERGEDVGLKSKKGMRRGGALRRGKKRLKAYSVQGSERKRSERRAMERAWERNKKRKGGQARCRECNVMLGSEMDVRCCAHILAKGAHEIMRDDDENIVILCYDHHDQLDFGKKEEMRIWGWLGERIEYLMKKHYHGDS